MGIQAVVILGSTGSIGRQTLSVIQNNPDNFSIFALVAKSSVDILLQQCCDYNPRYAYLSDSVSAALLRSRLKAAGSKTEVLSSNADLLALCAAAEVDIVVAGIVGAAGLLPTFTAAKAGKRILLANKESLVMTGEILMNTVQQNGAQILPVDSEHNAIFQSMPAGFVPGHDLPASVSSVVLTASGGPFLNSPLSEFPSITPEQAVAHPKWSMGRKISVDSATMMNKVLEVIEAHYLFSVPVSGIEVLIHPQSVVHSMVRYHDGSVISQMGMPDMKIPIAHCLAWPTRIKSMAQPLNLFTSSPLTFQTLCCQRYPCFTLINSVVAAGQSAMIVLNAANEIAVAAFLEKRISYDNIFRLIDSVLQNIAVSTVNNIDDVLAIDARARALSVQNLKDITIV